YVQGAGWLTLEDMRWDASDGPNRGRLLTQAASTYKLPSFSEMPEVFNVALYDKGHEPGAVYGSKAVGEPPLMLALSVREALRQAIASFGSPGTSVRLSSPSTPETVFWAIQAARGAAEAVDASGEASTERAGAPREEAGAGTPREEAAVEASAVPAGADMLVD
ncbi:MAG: xanthine dehydrogenase molybdopterin binding subunit, partial [Humibacter sp.]